MLFAWLKRRRRRSLIAAPFPEAWNDVLRENVRHFAYLDGGERDRLREDLRILIGEKQWEGCDGLVLTDEIRVTIAAQAALLLLGFTDRYFDQVLSVLIYPDEYLVPSVRHEASGVVHESESSRLGEAWYRGPVVLSWRDAKYGGDDAWDNSNVVIHEFAHQLDMESQSTNGTPVLRSRKQYRRWQRVMSREYEHLVAASHEHRATLLDQYGAQDEAEFFAVATETFFERPVDMQEGHQDLYDLLREYYAQDPATRVRRGPLAGS